MILGKFTYLYNNTCYNVCPDDGYYEDAETFECEACDPGCETCQGSASNCSTCKNHTDGTDYFKSPTNNSCLEECPDGYFKETDYTCVICSSGYGHSHMDGATDACATDCADGCDVCVDASTENCTKCVDNVTFSFYLQPGGVSCKETCPTGYYGTNGVC